MSTSWTILLQSGCCRHPQAVTPPAFGVIYGHFLPKAPRACLGSVTNPRRRINAPDLVTGGRGALSARPAVVALGICHPHHLSSCCRVQTSSRPLLRSSSSPQELLALISGLSSSLLLPRGPVLAQASLLALYFYHCNTLGCSLLRCGSCRKPGSRNHLDVVGAH